MPIDAEGAVGGSVSGAGANSKWQMAYGLRLDSLQLLPALSFGKRNLFWGIERPGRGASATTPERCELWSLKIERKGSHSI